MKYDLRTFDLREMLSCGLELRRTTSGSESMEAAAQRVAHFLYDRFRDPGDDATTDGAHQCAMVRVYRTIAYGDLEPNLQTFARNRLNGDRPRADLRCLCLLGSAGELPSWNDRRQSREHQAIPLPSTEMVEQAPMIAALARQFGLEPNSLVRPSASFDLAGKTYGIFHVEEAKGSPHIPAQEEFVIPQRLRSVIGFGGGLRTGDIFAVIMFTRVVVPAATADRFRTLALDAKTMFFGFDEGDIFDRSHAMEG